MERKITRCLITIRSKNIAPKKIGKGMFSKVISNHYFGIFEIRLLVMVGMIHTTSMQWWDSKIFVVQFCFKSNVFSRFCLN